jgi:hypothetical protein
MENAMSSPTDPVALALTQAGATGNEFVPTELLSVLAADPNPTSTIDDIDRGNAHFAAIRKDFHFLHTCKISGRPPTTDDQLRLTELMRWLIREFNAWTVKSDPECRKLAALFVVTAYCSSQGDFWPNSAVAIKPNLDIATELGRRISLFRTAPSFSTRSRTPNSDKETIERFMIADAAADWPTVISDWPRFGDHVFPDAFITQAVRYLQEFSAGTLKSATERVKQTVSVMLVLWSLTVSESLSLALVSSNCYVRICAVLRLLQQGHRHREKMTPTEDALLTQLFLAIASNPSEWGKWMLALNRHPIQYKAIQVSLGHALAQAPDSALSPYVDAIQLSTLGAARGVVADCLRAFRSIAPPARQRTLWKLAHERWLKWNFAVGDPHQNLINIGQCELDYAVIGFAVECMNDQELDDAYAALIAELTALDITWHTSVTDFRRSVNRILSRLQPYGHARGIQSTDDWLIENRYVLPFDPKTDRYNALLFRTQNF